MSKKKRNKRKNNLLRILIAEILIVSLLIVGYKVVSTYRKMNFNNSGDEDILQNDMDEENLKGYRNIAIFGVDSRSNALEKGTLSDSIIIASINNETKDVKLVSIYRDTYSNIPDYGFDKINHAYSKGGYPLSLSTINTNFDLNITEYITVNFKALASTIDALGGITLDIADDEVKHLNNYVRDVNRVNQTSSSGINGPGKQVINGTQATAYSRIRYTSGGDFKRAERQRTVIDAMVVKAKQTNIITLLSIIDDVFPQVSTNITAPHMIKLAKDLAKYNIVGQDGFPFEKDSHKYNGVSYTFPIDLRANVIQLHELLFEDEEYTPSPTVTAYSSQIEEIRLK